MLRRAMSIEDSYNFRRVDDSLTTSGVVGEGVLRGLADEGYEAVVNLLPDDSQYAVPDEREIVEAQGIAYVHIPVDFGNPTEVDLDRFVETMDSFRSRKAHVHCAANFRVSAFLSVYEVRKGNWTESEARAFVSDIWDPAEHPPWSALLDRMDDGETGSDRPT